jgi:diphosphomevalonate decarboxylase
MIDIQAFKGQNTEQNRYSEYTAGWESPSNIALIKYWGKHGMQLPMNPSLSFSLSEANTQTEVTFIPGGSAKIRSFIFEGKENASFIPKLEESLKRMKDFIPWIQDFDLGIKSANTFPHSAGIASSASSMSALALCIMDAEQYYTETKMDAQFFLEKASFLARLASGSASRSVFGGYVLWGAYEQAGNDLFARKLSMDLSEDFQNLNDSILIVDEGQKPVSSTAGHALMNGHPYAKAREEQAHQNMQKLLPAMQSGGWKSFAEIVENEAMSLHALMMSSSPSYMLMNAETVVIIEKIKEFREQSGVKLCFTLDAGPNLHLLYPDSAKDKVMQFLLNDLAELYPQMRIMHDRIGTGPSRIKK